jgi:hypothetical protein
MTARSWSPPPAGAPGATNATGGTGDHYPHDSISTPVNPWRTTAARCTDDELASWAADAHIVLTDAAGDDPASRSTREVVALMREAIERELALRRRAGARKPAPTGGLPREQARRLREEIRQRVDLVALVQQDVADLRPTGTSWRGRCPLCGASNPTTLTVWPASGRWRCWRCGAGGDVLAWLLATRRELDFRSALLHATLLAGLSLAAAVAWPSRRWEGDRR